MPYEAGPSLQQRVQQHGRLTVEEAIRVAAQVASALAAAHESGLVHRDIKPSNILLAPGTERALLTDFGLAQISDQAAITNTGVVSGTPQFMSPEQARGERVGCASDLFSLGSVIFYSLTGQPPVNVTFIESAARQAIPQCMEVAVLLDRYRVSAAISFWEQTFDVKTSRMARLMGIANKVSQPAGGNCSTRLRFLRIGQHTAAEFDCLGDV